MDRYLEPLIATHLARYTPAPPPPPDASWWALARHKDRQDEAERAAHAALSRDVHDAGAAAFEAARALNPGKPIGWDLHNAIWAQSLGDEPGHSLARQVCAAARAAVPFLDEPEPPPAKGGRIGLGKGTCSVPIPTGAIARRGGGEHSFVAFYDREGNMLAAYRTRSAGPDTWAEPASADYLAKVTSGYGLGPVLPCSRTEAERVTALVFGGRS